MSKDDYDMKQLEVTVSITDLDEIASVFERIAESMEDIADETTDEDAEKKLWNLVVTTYDFADGLGESE